MRLAEWRKWKGLSQEQLAAELGVTQPTISLLERWPDNSVPGAELMLRIYRLTHGAVAPNDFYNLPELEQLTLSLEDAPRASPAPLPLLEPAVDQPEPERIAA